MAQAGTSAKSIFIVALYIGPYINHPSAQQHVEPPLVGNKIDHVSH